MNGSLNKLINLTLLSRFKSLCDGVYAKKTDSLTLGETSSTAYAGNNGKKNADDIEALQTVVDDNAEVIASSLNDLNTRTENIEESIGTMSTQIGELNAVRITYAELKALRDAGNLMEGRQYCIDDYHCTTTQNDTQSADHQFDIIVTADDSSTLNENARACIHKGDTYFSGVGANLAAWELKYSIDNDASRFGWASVDGKGVIYWMKDEWNNECPYDFKNIMFKRYKINECAKSPDLVGKYGTIGSDEYSVDESTIYWCYTFCMLDKYDTKPHDVSVEQKKYLTDEGNYYCTHDNKFSSYLKITFDEQLLNRSFLPDNVLVTDTDITNIEEDYSCGRFYGYYCNTFGYDCCFNTFGYNCYYNAFGNDCCCNTFGNSCYRNKLGNYCYYNAFGNSCCQNISGNHFCMNVLGDGCNSNMFGNKCYYNTFGNDFNSNILGNDCCCNTFGNSCYRNSLDCGCMSNSFINYMCNCSFGLKVSYCKISCSTGNSAYLKNINVLNGTNGISNSNMLTISLTAGRDYCTYIGKDSSGTLKIWNPADLA